MVRCAAVLLLLLAAACAGEEPAADIPTEGVVTLSDQFTGDFALVDKTGAPVTDEDFEGKIMLVYFGFTNCPDICPTDVGVMSAALNQLGDKADEVAPLFISVDPERDTPEAMADYFAFDERIIPLTGSVEAAKAARNAFKVFAQKQPLPDSALGYTVQHQQAFFISDREGRPQIAMVGGASPEGLAAILRREIGK
ncbi:SCO family protein [Hyphococcus luteus]|uniref:SCO family protein n=1 Tax=Hyphococcus luteus TaxID=2058213 RepID=A0A2S7K5Z6_9PROT|nr:SCO family protein [Marinicaulis flavus]PQA87917.1 SCO family protein [Marinicaulis flavus]